MLGLDWLIYRFLEILKIIQKCLSLLLLMNFQTFPQSGRLGILVALVRCLATSDFNSRFKQSVDSYFFLDMITT